MQVDGASYVINIEKYGIFQSYQELFDFLYDYKGDSFIYTSGYGRPLQRKIYYNLMEELRKLYLEVDDYSLSYNIEIFECRESNTFFLYLNEGQQVVGLFERGFYHKPLNFV